jgi:dephospho-CoA kinase
LATSCRIDGWNRLRNVNGFSFAVDETQVSYRRCRRNSARPGTAAYALVVKQFGEDIILRDGSLQIDRKKLGGVVFRDAEKRKVLNSIVHPAVRWAMLSAVMTLWIHGESVCILDVPLLVEANLWKMVGWVVVVYCETK